MMLRPGGLRLFQNEDIQKLSNYQLLFQRLPLREGHLKPSENKLSGYVTPALLLSTMTHWRPNYQEKVKPGLHSLRLSEQPDT